MQGLGVEIQGIAGQRIERTVEHADDLRRFIADDALELFVPQHRHGYAPGIVGGIGGVALVHEVETVQFVAAGAVGLVEGPAVFQHQPTDHRDVDQAFQALELAQDQGAVRPRAGEGYIEVIATGLGLEAAFTTRAWRAIGGHPVAALCLFPLESAIGATFVPLVFPLSFDQ